MSWLRNKFVAYLLPPLACVLAATVLFACGSSDDEEPAKTAATPQAEAPATLLSDTAVKRQKAGTPQRAFLTWWQAVQFQDATTGYPFFTPKVRQGLSRVDFTESMRLAASGFAARPEFVGTTERGNRVILRTQLMFGATGKVTAVVPRAFTMQKVNGDWQIDDPSYLLQQAALGRDRERSSKK